MENRSAIVEYEVQYWKKRAEAAEAENAVLKAEVEKLKAEVVYLKKMLFGRKSEQQKAPVEHPETAFENDVTKRPRGQQPGTDGHGRRTYAQLPMEEVIHDLPADKCSCPHCGLPYEPFPGNETSEEIDYRVELVRVVHQRKRYRKTCQCPGVPGIVTAPPPPKFQAKGLVTPGFAAHLVTEKYLFARPTNKTREALRMAGLDMSLGTFTDVLRHASELLVPLEEACRVYCRAGDFWHMDETSWRVYEEVDGKTGHRWWVWVAGNPSRKVTIFLLDPTRSSKVPRKLLALDGENPARGILMSDDYVVYRSLGGGILQARCWAHMRRDFIEVGQGYAKLKEWAAEWIELIAQLYHLHGLRKQCRPGTEEFAAADNLLRDFVGKMKAVMEEQYTQRPRLPDAAWNVLVSMGNRWEKLTLFLDYLELPLDNNEAERLLRTPVLGRKNYNGSGSTWSAEAAARFWTVLFTVRQNGLNPLAYLIAYFQACAKNGGKPLSDSELAPFLPWTMDGDTRRALTMPANNTS